jgi:hypothetical protein
MTNSFSALSLILLTSAAMAQDQIAVEMPRWAPAARMHAARVDHCAVALDDGRVLIAGGTGAEGALSSVELYGPGDEFAPGPPMSVARSGHSCTKLLDGRILVAGSGHAEIFNPLTSSWTPVRGDIAPRRGHTATLLPGGSVVFAGGFIGDEPSGLLEIFSPEIESVTRSAATMLERRTRHAAALLSDGRILLIGGSNGTHVLTSNEIYDPVLDTVTHAAPLNLPRASHAAVSLPDGRVLIIGGEDGTTELGNAEAYREADNSMEWVASGLAAPVRNPFVALIPARGIVLIAGGESGGRAMATTQYFLPWLNRFVEIGSLTAPRTRIAGASLADGVIFATGGQNADGVSAACGVLTGPSITLAPTTSFAGTSATLFFPGQRVRVSGRGFRARANVKLSLRRRDGTRIDDRLLLTTVTTNDTGAFQADVFDVKSSDIGNRFLLGTSSPATSITDGTSNTIILSEVSLLAETGFDVKGSTATTARSTTPTILTGGAVPVEVTITSPGNTVPITGTVTVTIGSATSAFPVPSVAPGTPFNVVFCCAPTPGSHAVSVSYSGDVNYAPSGLRGSSSTVNVISNQVTIALSSSGFPLFTVARFAVQVRAAVNGIPVPTGTVTVRQTTGIPPAPSTLPLSRDVRSLTVPGAFAAFDFRATFVDKPSACFQIDYSGDSTYPAVTNPNVCVPVIPATPTLEITAPSTSYTFGTPFAFSIRLTFPPELGVTNRFIRVTPPGSDFNLQIGVGSANAALSLVLPFAEQAINVNYTGGGDLGQVRGLLSIRMLPAATQTKLDPLKSTSLNPINLRAVVSSPIPVGTTSTGASPVPSGTVQFFDGDLMLGQVQTTTNADGSTAAVLPNVARPVGTRSLKAVYLGNTQFAGSTSATQSVTIQ